MMPKHLTNPIPPSKCPPLGPQPLADHQNPAVEMLELANANLSTAPDRSRVGVLQDAASDTRGQEEKTIRFNAYQCSIREDMSYFSPVIQRCSFSAS
jgi:hypothetical protein